MRVFVLDKNLLPLDPCHQARARELLKKGRARVFKRYPFTIVMQDRTLEESTTHPHRIKIDPGSKVTGFAVIQEETGRVTNALEITHRGQQIKDALESRRSLRRGRRNRKTRYRKPRFLNRTRKQGWLPPSLESRIANIETWVDRIRKVCPITAISQELVRFDLQQLQNPEISGVEYQRGELFGFEVKEYLLAKWGRKCAYCGIENVPFEIEHILARSKGGSNRVSNLCLSCHSCNQAKGNQPVGEFLKKKPEILKRILAQAKAPLKDAAAVNATRWELYRRLQSTGLPVEVGTGGRTKFNRQTRGIEKTHWADAACVGASTPERLLLNGVKPLIVKAKGHGTRQRCRPDKYGFPKAHAPSSKSFQNFQTGDIVKANVPTGKFAGRYVGRVAIRFRPSFVLQLPTHKFDVHPKYLKTIHKADGYEYQT
ncbi:MULTISPECIES: RNA-guided endonuclease IscB [unclassified Microcoleus]|uniref:RNA-guided endonuclease IscB n=1 Tax=unclassified Microcoleus TaxID=2642155 RepID=UPI001E054AF8|nr:MULTISPECIES: RNA-guided endonuclease IscB [unclassified Microcoleus]MCC3501351.1 RRXRR domain-containing protein [Microcoleus sp. PH2017_19_SFW_U_A]TAG99269.1 MAG: HNH endonuclease [Oscillatoriales cyanobacterium]MCC3475724.1 RRXRR domain-containing protein [Microcoleus sp. PH2017_13_LAR_U_A]MCC3488249.1 RRXRR domain-containing protein [Microcoleus sp. PH2017_14_LAR_D_A]MCC3500445.1 RRXRR domain-containing protein [Microcoleus sp. PH2017_15_JOR_U_A]